MTYCLKTIITDFDHHLALSKPPRFGNWFYLSSAEQDMEGNLGRITLKP
jgi:hypothetical protein